MGHDGDGQSANPNANFAMDAMGYSLSYYQGDYSPIDTSVWNDTAQRFIAHYDGSDVDSTANDLYNGNIRHMVTTITKPQVYSDTANITPVILPQATTYEYDQLNRLIGAQAYQNLYAAGNYWQRDNNYSGQYENRFKYDANGNILSQLRKNALGAVIDSLNYRYHLDQNGDRVQNRLYHVQDSTSGGTYSDDIDDMGAFTASANNINDGSNNYSYDDIGQLIKDSQEEIDSILWRVDGKVKAIHRSSGSDKKELEFEYDAMGNRIAKHQYETGTGLNFGSWEKSTYYSRDAQGNVMAVYEYTIEDMVSSYKLKERNIYGSSRVGVYTDTIEMIGSSVDTNHYYHRIGDRYYECSNHLGNVLAVISDKRIPVDDYEVDNPFTIGGDSSGYNNWTAVGSPTISLDGDKLKVVTSSNNHGVEQHYGTTAGGQYRFTLDIDHGATSQKLWVYIKDKSTGVNLSERSYGGSVSGDVNIEFYAKGDSTTVQVLRRANGTYWKMDDAVFTRTNYVPINSDFESNQYSTADYQRWEPSSLTTVTRDSGRLKAETTNKYHSVSRFFGAHPGHQYQIDFDLEIGTMNKVTIFCLEYTSFSTKTTEYYTTRTSDDHLSFTVDAHATLHSNMRFYVARDDANGASKHFFLDNVTITDLTEENEGGQLGIPITAAAYPDVIQSGDYSPFGVQLDQRTFALDTTDTTGYRYGFNGMELDNEVKNGNGNHLDFGARCYDSRLGRFLSIDPLDSKHANDSPYMFAGNSPIIMIDANGEEKIIVVGAEYNSEKRYKYNFVEPALLQVDLYKVQRVKEKKYNEQITVVITTVGYTPHQRAKVIGAFRDKGATVVEISSADQLTTYFNKKRTLLKGGLNGVSENEKIETLASRREQDPITGVTTFAHGLVGSIALAYNQGDEVSKKFSYDKEDVKLINPKAFSQAEVVSFACNACTNPNNEDGSESTSFGEAFSLQTNTLFKGYEGKDEYKYINKGESWDDKMNRKLMGFNFEGSQRLPTGGYKDDRSNGKIPSEKKTFDNRNK